MSSAITSTSPLLPQPQRTWIGEYLGKFGGKPSIQHSPMLMHPSPRGFPRLAERGDSAGAVFLGGDSHELVGIIVGGMMASQASMPVDVYAPITEKNRRWALNQVPSEPAGDRASAGAR